MKKLSLLALVLLVLPLVQAAEIDYYDLEVVLEESLASETAEIFVNNFDSEESITLFLPPSISNLKVSLNDDFVECTETEIVGATEVICPTPRVDYFLDLEYETPYPLITVGDRKLFSQDFNFASVIGEFSLEIKLPERALLPAELSQFVTPEPDKIASDGRRIILSYDAEGVDSFEVSIFYDPVEGSKLFAVWIFLGLVGASLAVLLLRNKSGKKKKIKHPKKNGLHLLPDEKDVLKLIENSSGPIRQKDIETQVDFSKAKLSRVLRGLEERGVIRRIPKGNTNLVELRK